MSKYHLQKTAGDLLIKMEFFQPNKKVVNFELQ